MNTTLLFSKRNFSKWLCILCISLSTSIQLLAHSITGRVVDETSNPIADVNIINLSSGEVQLSNEQGFFSFHDVQLHDTIKLSHLGYETSTVALHSIQTLTTIVLKQKTIMLDAVYISPKVDALKLIAKIDVYSNPVNSSQDILKKVPGLFIGQHAGGGKAEQMFLRGFDVDHGTDIAIDVDGMPVNVVSHAHGQGYSDLHFIIPETVQKIDFGKGPYYAEKGNFNTAGFVSFKTRDRLKKSMFKLEGGQFQTRRMLGMFDLMDKVNHHAYIATEFIQSDGPFESPQNFHRINLFGKYSGNVSKTDKVGITLSHFNSKWDASGQIPVRSVEDGSISRFGAIDDTEGGQTSRSNVIIDYTRDIDDHSFVKNTFYYSNYNFLLFSNFTFFLNDSINGDQIKQKETRNLFGFQSKYNRSFASSTVDGSWEAGIGVRYDISDGNQLARTKNRKELLSNVQLGDIQEANYFGFLSANFNKGKWSFTPSVRLDQFDFQYNDALLTNYETQTAAQSIVSPKLAIAYNYSKKAQFYLKGGKGFHSNDTRVAVARNGKEILPQALGADLGTLWKPTSSILINVAYWYLYLEQEFVYVGDEGVVEPSGETRRQGVELSMRYQPLKWLYFNLDGNYTLARSIDGLEGENYIPLAPDFTVVAALNAQHSSGFYGGLNLRYIKDRPANEDNSITAEGYSILDCNIGMKYQNFDFGIQVQNVLNTEWNETQFATESRLQNETESVEEIHFTPGTPFFLKAMVSFSF